MSSAGYDPAAKEAETQQQQQKGEGAFLSSEERQALQRMLGSPEDFPKKFWSTLLDYIAVNVPLIPVSQIVGFKQAVRTSPVVGESLVTTTFGGDGTITTITNVVIPPDLTGVYVDLRATRFGFSAAVANPQTVDLTISETTAGTLISSSVTVSNVGASYGVPLYTRSADVDWSGSTRTITASITGTNCTAEVVASSASPISLRLMKTNP